MPTYQWKCEQCEQEGTITPTRWTATDGKDFHERQSGHVVVVLGYGLEDECAECARVHVVAS